MRSGYTKQDGTYVRAHGRGAHDDNYVTPETPLKIKEKKNMTIDPNKGAAAPQKPNDAKVESQEPRRKDQYSSPYEYKKAMELFSPEGKMTSEQQTRYDTMLAKNPNRTKLMDTYKKNHFAPYVERALYPSDREYNDADFRGIDGFDRENGVGREIQKMLGEKGHDNYIRDLYDNWNDYVNLFKYSNLPDKFDY